MKRILFCVLNWGLGHATRSLPLINELIKRGCDVQLASDGLAKTFLSRRYPQLILHNLPGYDARYDTSSVYLNALRGLPSFRRAITNEKKAVADLVERWSPHVIISDNRYGCYHSSVYSVLISHQLRLPAPNVIAQSVANVALNKILKPFNELWVPDRQPPNHITGRMSQLNDKRVRFIGLLSSMSIKGQHAIKNSILILLSGPEPARTILESRLLELNLYDTYLIHLIRGTSTPPSNTQQHMSVADLATSREVNQAILKSEIIICRPGYSTVMDLLSLGRTAIYIPTPGQPEQMLLAKHLETTRRGVPLEQKNLTHLTLQRAIKELRALPTMDPCSQEEYVGAISDLLNKL